MRRRFRCVKANAGFAFLNDRAMLGVFIKIGNVTAGEPADLVLERALQDQREFFTAMAVLKHGHAGGNGEQLQGTLRAFGQGQFINGNTGCFFPPAQLREVLTLQKALKGCRHIAFHHSRLGGARVIKAGKGCGPARIGYCGAFQIIQYFAAQRFSFANRSPAFRAHADVAGRGNAQGFAQGSRRVAEDGGIIQMVNNGQFTTSNNLRMRL